MTVTHTTEIDKRYREFIKNQKRKNKPVVTKSKFESMLEAQILIDKYHYKNNS